MTNLIKNLNAINHLQRSRPPQWPLKPLTLKHLVSGVLQQLGRRQSGHARSNNDHTMRCVDVRFQAGLHGLQQLSVVFVLQTISQVFLHADSSRAAAAQCEQQHAERHWTKHREKNTVKHQQEFNRRLFCWSADVWFSRWRKSDWNSDRSVLYSPLKNNTVMTCSLCSTSFSSSFSISFLSWWSLTFFLSTTAHMKRHLRHHNFCNITISCENFSSPPCLNLLWPLDSRVDSPHDPDCVPVTYSVVSLNRSGEV